MVSTKLEVIFLICKHSFGEWLIKLIGEWLNKLKENHNLTQST